MTIEKLVEKMWSEIDNSLFLSKEVEDCIEHVDDTYSGFKEQIKTMMYEAYEFGKDYGYRDGFDDGEREERNNHVCDECELDHVH